MLALRGIAAILFAFCAYFWPGLTLFALVILFGVYAFADGIMAAVVGARAHWWTVSLFGFIGIAAGIATIFRPDITAVALLSFIAVWAIRGAFSRLRRRSGCARRSRTNGGWS